MVRFFLECPDVHRAHQLSIRSLKPVPCQLCVTISNIKDVELNDGRVLTEEKPSSIYVKAWTLGEKDDAQQRDVHYRFV